MEMTVYNFASSANSLMETASLLQLTISLIKTTNNTTCLLIGADFWSVCHGYKAEREVVA